MMADCKVSSSVQTSVSEERGSNVFGSEDKSSVWGNPNISEYMQVQDIVKTASAY